MIHFKLGVKLVSNLTCYGMENTLPFLTHLRNVSLPRPLILPLHLVVSVFFVYLTFLKRMDRKIIRLNIETTHFEGKQNSCFLG